MKMHELLAQEKDKEQRQQLELLIKKETMQRKPSLDVSLAELVANSSSVNESILGSGKKRSDVDVAFVCIACEQEFEERDMLLKHQRKLHKELELNIVSSGKEQEPADEGVWFGFLRNIRWITMISFSFQLPLRTRWTRTKHVAFKTRTRTNRWW